MTGVLLASGIAGLAIDLHGRAHNDYLLIYFDNKAVWLFKKQLNHAIYEIK